MTNFYLLKIKKILKKNKLNFRNFNELLRFKFFQIFFLKIFYINFTFKKSFKQFHTSETDQTPLSIKTGFIMKLMKNPIDNVPSKKTPELHPNIINLGCYTQNYRPWWEICNVGERKLNWEGEKWKFFISLLYSVPHPLGNPHLIKLKYPHLPKIKFSFTFPLSCSRELM